MNQQALGMHFLYNARIVENEFSKEKFLQSLQDDVVYPITGTIKQYEKYEHIMKESGIVGEIFFIVSGYIVACEGKTRISHFYGSQDIIGLENLMLESPTSYSFEVISDKVKVIKYKKVDIIEKLFNTQEGYLYHYVYMQDRMTQMIRREQLLRLSSEERISLALFRLSERYGEPIPQSNVSIFPKAINKGMLARYTNLNPKP
ncbi:Crp/Fnr family transcriptional regulator [Listeria rustica]|uniref:Crp/Fnr family transcriptional regulator n=1 Tax=Listeria rustica TaxID=2713503 RepID=A0A7W1T6M4_9LIST|nr:Crp/Fnr family transcriptional regulator [Listeria rustica]MBA3926455.1 Crp/Fnr family transcriptional regulator [Listeria rustica]